MKTIEHTQLNCAKDLETFDIDRLTYNISNTDGVVVLQSNMFPINISHLNSGTYTISIFNSDNKIAVDNEFVIEN